MTNGPLSFPASVSPSIYELFFPSILSDLAFLHSRKMRWGVSLQVRECCLDHETILCLLLPRIDREIDIKTNWSGQCWETHFPPEVQFLLKIPYLHFPRYLRNKAGAKSRHAPNLSRFPHLPLLSRTHAKFAPSKTHPPTQLEERDFLPNGHHLHRPKTTPANCLCTSTVLVHPPSLFSLVPPTPLASKRHHPTCTTYRVFPHTKTK